MSSVAERATALATAFAIALALTACGGSAPGSTTTSASRSTGQATTTSPRPATSGPVVTSGPVHGALSARNHAPTVGKPWPYSVTVTDPGGRPLSGTVDIEFLFSGQVVGHDTPPTHPVRHGRWTERVTYPAAAVGQPLTFQAVVHTARGSITLDWPVRVRK